MHIAFCLTHSDIGGGQEVVFTLVKTLIVQHPDKKFSVILPPGGLYIERFKYLSADVFEMPFDRISFITLIRSFFLFRTLKPDVLHSHGKGAGFYARWFPNAFLPLRRIHSYHGFHAPVSSWRRRFYLSMEKLFLKHTDMVVSVSASEGEEASRALSVDMKKFKMIRNCVDQGNLMRRSIEPLPKQMASFLERRKGTFIVTMIGREDSIKNYPLAFSVVDAVLQKGMPISFVFIGINPASAIFSNLAKKYADSLYAIQSLENTAPVLAISNALLITSRKEGAPIVVLEAFCFGIPVVGTNVAGTRDLVESGTNGMLCDEKSESLATAIENLCSDASLYARLREGALASAASMDVTDWAGQYYALYENKRT